MRLTIPRIGVTAKVTPAGVDQAGAFSVPPSVDTVGWYRFGPALDSPAGSLVIGGHVDSAAAGPGALFRLRELDPGSALSLTGEDGVTRSYVVVAREQIPKDKIDLQPYFATTGSPRVTLFTCGGSFDRAARSYRDNIVVTAVPA
ncbi:class F sortase [Amycolatopsis sp. cmx-8-4]|uniref:class F sortase n=1 Tax=Amycolatopsis sp. cmx-8-4 TaxID=2790947 RepID=UPI00397BE6FF